MSDETKDRIGFDVTPVAAQTLYEAYCESSEWKNWQGLPCPTWAELPDAIKQHWEAVVLKARELYVPGPANLRVGPYS